MSLCLIGSLHPVDSKLLAIGCFLLLLLTHIKHQPGKRSGLESRTIGEVRRDSAVGPGKREPFRTWWQGLVLVSGPLGRWLFPAWHRVSRAFIPGRPGWTGKGHGALTGME